MSRIFVLGVAVGLLALAWWLLAGHEVDSPEDPQRAAAPSGPRASAKPDGLPADGAPPSRLEAEAGKTKAGEAEADEAEGSGNEESQGEGVTAGPPLTETDKQWIREEAAAFLRGGEEVVRDLERDGIDDPESYHEYVSAQYTAEKFRSVDRALALGYGKLVPGMPKPRWREFVWFGSGGRTDENGRKWKFQVDLPADEFPALKGWRELHDQTRSTLSGEAAVAFNTQNLEWRKAMIEAFEAGKVESRFGPVPESLRNSNVRVANRHRWFVEPMF